MKRFIFLLLLSGVITVMLLFLVEREANFNYITAPVERGDIINTIMVTGSVSPVGEVKVGSQISGQLAEMLVDYNHEVKKGQPLARLDSTIFEATVREAQSLVEVAEADVIIKEAGVLKAKSNLKNKRGQLAVAEAHIDSARAIYQQAKSDFRRKEVLAEKGSVSMSELDKAKAEHYSSVARLRAEELEHQVRRSAILSAEAGLYMANAEVQYAKGIIRQRQAALDRVREELERTVIRAPIDGIIIGRDVETGQTVAAALEAPTLFTLVKDLRQIEVKAIIDEADIGRVHIGQKVSFTVAAYSRRHFSGHVIEIHKVPRKVENVVTYTVVISAGNADQALFPGMTATIQIMVESVQAVLKVPNAALRFQLPESVIKQYPQGAGTSLQKPDVSSVVWVLDKNRNPVPLEISTGFMDDFSSELLNGALNEGDVVIVRSERIPAHLFDLSFGW